MSTLKQNDKIIVPVILTLSVVVPALVAFLMFSVKFDGDVMLSGVIRKLPAVNAVINTAVSILLILGLVFVRQKKFKLHKYAMVTALILSVFFLVSYVIYHGAFGDVKYGGTGVIKVIYLFILFTHIVLSVAVVPLALFAVYRGLTHQLDRHKKIVRWAWPIWLYVSVTGPIVYLMVHVFNPATI